MNKLIEFAKAPAILLVCNCVLPANAADGVPDISGMWSDPPASAEDAFCHTGCLVAARNYLTELLEDPANLDRSYAELRREAQRFAGQELVPSLLTPEALENYPFDSRDDPSLLTCEPWGFARQAMAPHAVEITQYEDRVTIYYSEWTALRTIYLDGRDPPEDLSPSLLGFSVGFYEDDSLVVETMGISANHTKGIAHSDQLTAIERFSRSEDGNRLDLELTLRDPLVLREPLVLARGWTWAPQEEIYPYEDCALPGEELRQ